MGLMTMSCAVAPTAQRQRWSKIANRATVEKFEDQFASFEHAVVINRQPVEMLEDGCNMSILSMICNTMCKSILNDLQLM